MTPPSTRSRITCHIVRRLRGSSPAVGSSRKMIRGSPTRVIARSSRRCIPPDQVGHELAGRVDEVEPLEQLRRSPAALGPAEVAEVGHQDEVLLAGEELVDGRELAGHADRGADGVGLAADVVARDLRPGRRRR